MTKRKESADTIMVYVSVHPALRDFLISVYGSDVLVPDDKSVIWATVKSNLVEVPNDYKPHTAGPVPGKIRIALPPISASSPIYNFALGEKIITNFLYRNYLSHKAQVIVADLLMKQFKDTYRSFMTGYLAAHPNQTGKESQIKDGIDEFCRIHRISMDDKITYEMLRKDWYRWRNRESESEYCDDVKENI